MQKVIIYRSQNEAYFDEFIQDNPWFALCFVGILIIIFVIYYFKQR
jgi:hypothetical protein